MPEEVVGLNADLPEDRAALAYQDLVVEVLGGVGTHFIGLFHFCNMLMYCVDKNFPCFIHFIFLQT